MPDDTAPQDLSPAERIRQAVLEAPTHGDLDGPYVLRGQEVFVRAFGGTERDRFEAKTLELEKTGGYTARLVGLRARLLAATLCTADGVLIFDAGSQEDLEALGAITVEEVEPLFDAATRLNKLTKADVDELAGNSET